MIQDDFIYNEFKKFESKFQNSLYWNNVSPFHAQIGFGKTGKAWKDQKYSAGCAGHKLLFKTHDIISSYCFDCYKVEIHPGSVLELFKLMFLFNGLELDDNNHRKLWLRPKKEIPVNYSGTMYFRSKSEAIKNSEVMRDTINKEIVSGMPIKVKRGCSEFNDILPNYHDINEDYNSLVADKNKWQEIELHFDRSQAADKLSPVPVDILPSIDGFDNHHFKIMWSWLNFAQSIGDDSYKKVTNTSLDHFERKEYAKKSYSFEMKW